MKWDWRTNRSILLDIEKVQKEMFESLEEKVTKIVNASDAMQVVLADVRAKLAAIIASGGMSDEAKAKLVALETALDTEADDIIAKTLEGTPAEPPA
jgi:hypothetical protein